VRDVLETWVNDADALQYIDKFALEATPVGLAYLRGREDDYYISLVGELFTRLHEPYEEPLEWSRLGNALTQTGLHDAQGAPSPTSVALPRDTALFAATAFYLGGFSASAYLTLKAGSFVGASEGHLAAYELLARPASIESVRVRGVVGAVRRGDLDAIADEEERARGLEATALQEGPEEWVGWRLYAEMLHRFRSTNIRAVLPAEPGGFWDQLVRSLLNRIPPVWDFFPSQIEAIRRGLLEANATFSLQMPTGAGKTALTETVVFSHLKKRPADVGVVLVPYRALASELRGTLVARLNQMDLNARAVYGGTVPTGAEVHALEEVRALVATPEALSGLLSADSEFFRRISLVICDEGHLLDSGSRGVSLELLLARMRARDVGAPKFVFVSAIVPNIEEINAWLGGTPDSVVRSDYRPALAEFARLDSAGSGVNTTITLRLHPHEETLQFDVDSFLSREDFRYRNSVSGQLKTYGFTSIKAQAVATARKALAMGSVAVFAANKRGNQGCVGMAEELLSQLAHPLTLPTPLQFVGDAANLQGAYDYLLLEYGADWVGTRALEAGAVLHHGDVPQETREVVEKLLRDEAVRLVFCTNTLAEGVNLPIRTLVLYSVQRRMPDGAAENLLARDIKNLVGRAGRAGTTTKGLVVCANAHQWSLIDPVARQQPGEQVRGALLDLMERIQRVVQQRNLTITNDLLERSTDLHALIDGVDATLIDLAAEELGEDQLRDIAGDLAQQTYAAQQAQPNTTALMREVFELRAERIIGIRRAGRLEWIRETGTRARMLDSVQTVLLPARESWDDIAVPTDPALLNALLVWAWDLPDIRRAIAEAYGDDRPTREAFGELVRGWLDGRPLVEIARNVGLAIDDMLAVHAKVVTYELQTAVEQGIALLRKFCDTEGRSISNAVLEFPDHLRFGVPSPAGRILAGAIRHRRAAVALGASPELAHESAEDRERVLSTARELLDDTERWLPLLGRLVLENTIVDMQRPSGSVEAG
jgi:superfamily II DNA/RNA helicase